METLSNMTKTEQRKAIAADTAKFLMRGGQITVVPVSHPLLKGGRNRNALISARERWSWSSWDKSYRPAYPFKEWQQERERIQSLQKEQPDSAPIAMKEAA